MQVHLCNERDGSTLSRCQGQRSYEKVCCYSPCGLIIPEPKTHSGIVIAATIYCVYAHLAKLTVDCNTLNLFFPQKGDFHGCVSGMFVDRGYVIKLTQYVYFLYDAFVPNKACVDCKHELLQSSLFSFGFEMGDGRCQPLCQDKVSLTSSLDLLNLFIYLFF